MLRVHHSPHDDDDTTQTAVADDGTLIEPEEPSLHDEDNALEVNYFIPSSIVNYNISDLQGETLRRMEIYVLRLLHRFNCAFSDNIASPPTAAAHAQLHRLRNELLVMAILHKNLQHGIVSTQRDIFYQLVRFVRNQEVVNAVVQQLVDSLRVPRQALGVVAGSRGCVGGTLTYRGIHLRARTMSTAESFCIASTEEGSAEGAPIPSSEEEVRVQPWHSHQRRQEEEAEHWATNGPFCILPQTRFILVIEKHAVFYRLMAERLYQKVPCVLVTSHGFPTHTARLLVHNLHKAAPHLPVVGLVDYNPSGLAILLQYKWGGTGMRENAFTCVPALRWLGVRGAQLQLSLAESREGAPPTATAAAGGKRGGTEQLLSVGMQHKPFTPRDTSLLANVVKKIQVKLDEAKTPSSHVTEDLGAWLTETAIMQQHKIKVELEALYVISEQRGGEEGGKAVLPSSSGFSAWVCQHLLKRDFI